MCSVRGQRSTLESSFLPPSGRFCRPAPRHRTCQTSTLTPELSQQPVKVYSLKLPYILYKVSIKPQTIQSNVMSTLTPACTFLSFLLLFFLRQVMLCSSCYIDQASLEFMRSCLPLLPSARTEGVGHYSSIGMSF